MSAAGHDERLAIDPLRVSRLFEAPRRADADDFLQREVGRRLLERLITVRIDAARVLDLGCGDGGDLDALRERFDESTVIGVDAAGSRLRRASAMKGGFGLPRFLRRDRGPVRVQADLAALPFAAKSVDVLWSNLALHWSAQPHRVLPEWSRVARVGGLVAFSAFGPDTLREVTTAFREADGWNPVLPFTDMHDYGDMLVGSGFTTPVVDMERLTLTYADPSKLWRDVRALGGNARTDRRRGLAGRAFGERLGEALDRGRDPEGRHRLTFELIFAHAWKGEPRTTRDGDAIIRLQRGR